MTLRTRHARICQNEPQLAVTAKSPIHSVQDVYNRTRSTVIDRNGTSVRLREIRSDDDHDDPLERRIARQ
jgi:hypothetical protein